MKQYAPDLDIWRSDALEPYEPALARMEAHVEAIQHGASTALWLLEHPPLFTAGTSAKSEDLFNPNGFPVYEAGRGGEYTYHGPGQRVAYVMMDLKQRAGNKASDLRAYVQDLEQWIIHTLAEFGVKGEVRDGRIGVWVVCPDGQERKIAAIGIRVRKWVAFHGIAINLNPDLSHFGGIVPCGIREFGVTSLHELQPDVTMAQLDEALITQFKQRML